MQQNASNEESAMPPISRVGMGRERNLVERNLYDAFTRKLEKD
jgi:hypothetical protein